MPRDEGHSLAASRDMARQPDAVTGPAFATFWAGGQVSAYEAACFSSYVRRGHDITVYTYAPIGNLPAGVATRSAEEIVEHSYMSGFRINGTPSLSHFSDLFRYRLFQKTDAIWVDCDMYLLRALPDHLPAMLLAREDASTLCGALMRIDRTDPALARLIARTEAASQRPLTWGETGPRLLTAVFGTTLLAGAFGPEQYFPVHYNDFWKVFLPDHRAECEALCAGAFSLHLWNNIVTKVGIWKDVMPPEGSYLHGVFVRDGLEDLFAGCVPVGPMTHMIDNYRNRISGTFSDVAKIARVAGPGFKRMASRQLRRALDLAAGRS